MTSCLATRHCLSILALVSVLGNVLLMQNHQQNVDAQHNNFGDIHADDSVFWLPALPKATKVTQQTTRTSITTKDAVRPNHPSSDSPESTPRIIQENNQIRKWGCHRMETPLIFVHIGKAGGGQIRARFAAAALDYERSADEWKRGTRDDHYYPLPNDQRAKFCTSKHVNHRIPNPHVDVTKITFKNNNNGTEEEEDEGSDEEGDVPSDPSEDESSKRNTLQRKMALPYTFEGSVPCAATTPLGMALACPEPTRRGCPLCGARRVDCPSVYMGHNALGSELHWLPPKMLQDWWEHHWMTLKGNNNTTLTRQIQKSFKFLKPPSRNWCQGKVRPASPKNITALYHDCGVPLAKKADKQFHIFWNQQYQNLGKAGMDAMTLAISNTKTSKATTTIPSSSNATITTTLERKETERHLSQTKNNNNNNNKHRMMKNNFAPIYASLPVHRVVLLREPYGWLISKFFWHRETRKAFRCDNLEHAKEWIHEYATSYMGPICGVDCINRLHYDKYYYYHNNTNTNNTVAGHQEQSQKIKEPLITLEELEAQASDNLKYSFSVVGLLHETDTFYDMVSTRFGYLNMSMNPHVTGERHATKKTKENIRCAKVFQEDEEFRETLRQHIPALRAMERLYALGVQVNQFQKQELATCNSKNM